MLAKFNLVPRSSRDISQYFFYAVRMFLHSVFVFLNRGGKRDTLSFEGCMLLRVQQLLGLR